MIDFESELKEILKDDPLGVLKNRTVQPITSDQRLKDSFEEINKFIDENGNEPTESADIMERNMPDFDLFDYSSLPEEINTESTFDEFKFILHAALLCGKVTYNGNLTNESLELQMEGLSWR